MPKKPGKYEPIIRALWDEHYFYNGYIYSGKDSDGIGLTEAEGKKFLVSTQVWLRLKKTLQGSNRNITADNWFSSKELSRNESWLMWELWRKTRERFPTNFNLIGTEKYNPYCLALRKIKHYAILYQNRTSPLFWYLKCITVTLVSLEIIEYYIIHQKGESTRLIKNVPFTRVADAQNGLWWCFIEF